MQNLNDLIFNTNPFLSHLCKLSDLVGEERTILHAGPPFYSANEIPPPVMNSIVIAAIYEGWASDKRTVLGLIDSGAIRISPAQDFNVVVPLAGVVSNSMVLMAVVDNQDSSLVKYSVINEGVDHCARLGKNDPYLVGHLKWLNGDFSDWLNECLVEKIYLLPLIFESIANGDDCHANTSYSSKKMISILSGFDLSPPDKARQEFLDNCPAFCLNLWMCVASLILDKFGKSSSDEVVTHAGGNGVRFGVKTSRSDGEWKVVSSPFINGENDNGLEDAISLGALGDSAVVDFFGLGGQLLTLLPEARSRLSKHLPYDIEVRAKNTMLFECDDYEGMSGVSLITSVDKCRKHEKGPLVLLGKIDANGVLGRVGGGVCDIPYAIFNK